MERSELSFDGKGINGPGEYRSRIATFTSQESADQYGRLFEAAPDLLKALQILADLDNCNDGRDRLAAFDAKYGIKPGEGRYNFIYSSVHAAIAKAIG